ncbi:MAG: hypothetical protein K2Y18_04860 [Alphaproteobacteria bacterium]|jgi:hypothetical protein|nr:hypothetical protein [Alphaproteobacteria bacterium]
MSVSKSKTVATLSALGLIVGFFAFGGEDATAAQKPYKMKMSRAGQGRIHAYASADNTQCLRTHKNHITCQTEVKIEIGLFS